MYLHASMNDHEFGSTASHAKVSVSLFVSTVGKFVKSENFKDLLVSTSLSHISICEDFTCFDV